MTDNINQKNLQRGTIENVLKGWVMVILTVLFVSLYAAALTGWLKPLSDVTMITRLEPIIFVIIGYYFGRLPAQANERTLKEEIDRHTKRTDASQHAKETAEKEREVMEEKIRNAKIALGRSEGESTVRGEVSSLSSDAQERSGHSIATAISILDS